MKQQQPAKAAVMAIGGFAAAVSFIFGFNARAELWDSYNNPANMDLDGSYQYNLDRLPLEATLATPPWSETYWPANKGSINLRWNSATKDGFNYYPPSQEEVASMTEDQIAQLSPAEKYDIYRGNYDYPLWYKATSWAIPKAPDWYGMCDGWSMASTQYTEPDPIRAKSPDGITVPFGSSDIKGLMIFAAVSDSKVTSYQVGSKCEGPLNSYDCQDINPGALHVILANQIGIKHQAFVTERDPGVEIWNQPTFGYKFQILGSAYSSDGDHGVLVHGTLYYTDELDQSQWNPVVGTSNFKSDKLEMDYVLDLDEQDNIIGGSWIMGSDHPDFVWIPSHHLDFTGYLSGLNELYHPHR